MYVLPPRQSIMERLVPIDTCICIIQLHLQFCLLVALDANVGLDLEFGDSRARPYALSHVVHSSMQITQALGLPVQAWASQACSTCALRRDSQLSQQLQFFDGESNQSQAFGVDQLFRPFEWGCPPHIGAGPR